MSIDVKLISGANATAVGVTDENALYVQDQGLPPPAPQGRGQVFRQFMTDDGTSSGSNDMQVDGSSTAVEFWVQADSTYDLYISSLSFVIADASATLNKFGNITALTNGCQLEYFTDGGTTTIADALKTNFDFVRLCLGIPSFGDGAGAFRASNVESTSEGYLPVLDIKNVFGIPWGIRLRPGTSDKIILRVRDDTTGVDAFNCIAYGFTRV
jgi:hypothetical protein